MSKVLSRVATVVLLLIIISGAVQSSGYTQATQQARRLYKQGEVARQTGNLSRALALYRQAIALDSAYIEAHQEYILVSRQVATTDADNAVSPEQSSAKNQLSEAEKLDAVNTQLLAQYKQWSTQRPRAPGYLWAQGFLNNYRDPKAAIRFYTEALEIDRKFAPAYQSLAFMNEAQGKRDEERENLRQAVEAAPRNPSYLFNYAFSFRKVNDAEFARLSLQIVDHYPGSEKAAQALYWLAMDASQRTEKVRYLEELKGLLKPAAADWRSSGMFLLFDLYDQTDGQKSSALAHEMAKPGSGDYDDWRALMRYSLAMLSAKQLISSGQPDRALQVLDNIKIPKWFRTEKLVLARARARSASGQGLKAYQDLLMVESSSPSDQTRSMLAQLGEELGKEPRQIEADTWALREKASRPANPIDLPGYSGTNRVSLDDFRGHVTLLNFWYPECGPCRNEFSYLQAVLDKFKSQGVNILAINVEPNENQFVLPLLRGFGLGFIPLEGNDAVKEAYKVDGEPTNFLIGADGRIYFGPLDPVSTPEAQHTLELQVEALLRSSESSTK